MAFITAPDFKIASVNWVFRRPSQVNTSGWTGRRTVVANPWHGKWLASVELAPMKTDDMRAVRAFFAKAKGTINTFRLYASEGPQNNNGGVTASAAAAGATSMTISGADVPMTEGQFVTVNGQLLLLTADQSGSTISFEPPLRAAVAGSTPVVTRRPYLLAHLASADVSWSAEPGVFYAVSFSVEEAILETDGNAPELTSAPFNTAAPVISGTPTQGQTLSSTTGTWSYSPTYARQWLRNGAAISGATGTTYVLTAGDAGAYITVRITATNATGSVTAVSNSLGPVVALSPPVNTVLPAITGEETVGETLTVSNGTWTGAVSYTRQWLRNGTNIVGATGATYVLVAADEGASIRALITATNANGSTTAMADAVGPIELSEPPVNLTVPVISGSLYVGAQLSTTNGTWDGLPSSYTYQWKRGGVNIGGATASTYTLVEADGDALITAAVTATNAQGPGSPATSAAVGPIDPFAFYMSFIDQIYASAGVDYGALSAVPGYTFSSAGAKSYLTGSTAVVYGPELITNGTFNTDITGWTEENGTGSVSSGVVTVSQTALDYGRIYQAFTCEVGKIYEASIGYLGGTAPAYCFINTSAGGTPANPTIQFATADTNPTTLTGTFVAPAATMYLVLSINTSADNNSCMYDNVTVKLRSIDPLPVQAFAADVPGINALGYHAYGALTNLLLNSQALGTADWGKASATVTTDTTVAPDGTTTADTVTMTGGFDEIYQLTPSLPTSVHTYSHFFKRTNNDWVALTYHQVNKVWFNLATGTVGTQTGATGYIKDCGNGWYRCTIVFTPASANQYIDFRLPPADGSSANAAVGQSVAVWQGDCFSGNFPDGGPVIATAGATAAIGASNIALTDVVADGTQLFWSVADFDGVATTGGLAEETVATWSDGTDNNEITWRHRAGGDLFVVVRSGAANTYNVAPATLPTGQHAIVMLREGGNWRAGRVTGGVLTWFGAAAAGAFPVGMNKASPGNYPGGGYNHNDHVHGQFRRFLTDTSDANILAVVAETM